MKNNLALIKMGGSVATYKDRPVSANYSAIEGFSKAISLIKEVPIILVHGGGSFGHYWSVKYNMHTKAELYDSRGISMVHESMLALNQIIVKSMLEEGLAPYGISPTTLFADGKVNVTKVNELVEYTRRGIVPVIFGDVVHLNEGRFSIVSGDSLMTSIATYLMPSRVIFTVNVDGIYEDMTNKKLVKVLNFPGGMGRKISEAFEIARLGIDVNIVNGLNAERVFDILSGLEVEGTMIPAISPKGKK